jgi:hypothetical protein
VTSAAEVNIFVVEPRRNSMSDLTGAPVSMSATPTPLLKTTRSRSTSAIAAPGVLVSCSSRRTASTIASKRDAAG